MGHGGVGDAGRGRPARQRLVRVGGGGRGAALGRRERLRHAARRGLRALQGARAHAPPALPRVDPPRARAGEARRAGGRALPQPAPGRTRRRDLGLGLPPPLRPPRLVRRRPPRLQGRQAGPPRVEPTRRLGGGDVRRPGGRVEADQRADLLRPGLTPVRRHPARAQGPQRGRQRPQDDPPGGRRRRPPAAHAGHARRHRRGPGPDLQGRGHGGRHRGGRAARRAVVAVVGR